MRFALLALAALAASDAQAFDVRYGTKGMPVSFGNPYMASGSPSAFTWAAMFDGLSAMDDKGVIGPALALSWEVVNPVTWRFKLRPNVKFSNGEPFNADAVIATIAWLQTPEGARSVVGVEARDIVSASKEDELTVLIKTEKPDAILPQRLSAVSIVAPKAWTELGPEKFARAPATTGSFMVKEWPGAASRLTLDAFPGSWRPAKAARLIIANIPDNPSRIQALLSGQIDIAGNIGIDDIDIVEQSGGKVTAATGWSVQSLGFRIERGKPTPLADVRVRQALNYAVDKKMIVDGLFRGNARVASQPGGVGTMGYDPDIAPYPYDPAKAKKLLAEAGYPDGLAFRFDVMIDRTPGDATVFQTVADQLAMVGVKLELRQVTFPTWLQNYLSGNWPADTDGFGLGWNAAPYNDVARPMEVYSCIRTIPFYCDRELTAQLEAANQEMDRAKREQLLKALSRAYHDAAPALFINETIDLFGATAKVEGLEIHNRVPAYHKITLK